MQLRSTLPPLPPKMQRLHIDPDRGFPVPWFVQWFNGDRPTDAGIGRPDYRVTDTRKLKLALDEERCWICGDFRGRFLAFNIGPMCAINRITSEPPSHLECARFAALACPFLSNPDARRRADHLPEGKLDPAGVHVERNPGVSLIWVTRSFHPFRAQLGKPGILFSLGDPVELYWFYEGRPATRAEIMNSIESGFPLLRESAMRDGEEAVREIEEAYKSAIHELVPR